MTTKPEIYVEDVADPDTFNVLGPCRVVARVGGYVGILYLYYGEESECRGIADYLSRVAASTPSLRALLHAIGRSTLAELVQN